MSAIFGLVNQSSEPVASANLERMNAALVTCGPDSSGIWTGGYVGLGQRLMCFTPEDRSERQPLVSADGQRVLVSDARIDNRLELAPELDIPPSGARDLPDSTFILSGYEKWGEDCVHHLVGVFTFALWDTRTQSLLIARSPITAPALFYFSAPQVFAFATMPKGLHALPFITRALNEEKLADMLVQSWASPTTTIYQGIHRLKTGHSLTVQRDGVKVKCFWRPDLKREIRLPGDEDYIAALDELLGRVVSDNLRSVTPVGAMMSGGLDSSSVAATAARLLKPQGERLTAFTEVPRAGFDGPVPYGRYADETPFVQAIAGMYDNLDLVLVHTNGRTFLDDLDRTFSHLEMPIRNVSNRVWGEAILQQAREGGIRVILDGGYGNLTISWDGSGLLPTLLRGGQWSRALRQARALAQRGAARSTFRALVGQGIMPLLPTPLWLAVGRLRGKPEARSRRPWLASSPIHPDWAAAYKVDERAREHGRDFRLHDTRDSREILYDALTSQDIGAYMTAYRSMFGVDSRWPLADLRLVEFCLALPEEQFVRDGEPRSLVRRAMAGRLPPQVLANRRRGLQAADWFERSTGARREIAAELEQLEQCDLARRALDLARMRRLVEQWPSSGWETERVRREYNNLLERGLTVGRFLRWIDESGTSPRVDA